jgi:hypothetical protein
MGQAKSRGTYEERVRHAVSRNVKLAAQIKAHPPGTSPHIRHTLAKDGIQRVATRLAQQGAPIND